jgi:chemotaxis protein CheD
VKADRIYLKPGELVTTHEPAIITTILGSCVAVTMFSKRLRMGSICHAMLPKNPPSNGSDTFRYVDSSILYMIEKLLLVGVRKDEIVVKLLGGADVLDRIDGRTISVGQQNIRQAVEIIRKEGLSLAACDVGGQFGRKIVFYGHTGRVLLRRVNREIGKDLTHARSSRGEQGTPKGAVKVRSEYDALDEFFGEDPWATR